MGVDVNIRRRGAHRHFISLQQRIVLQTLATGMMQTWNNFRTQQLKQCHAYAHRCRHAYAHVPLHTRAYT
eukprot:7850097-Prorocentrum_lima.AAC.1